MSWINLRSRGTQERDTKLQGQEKHQERSREEGLTPPTCLYLSRVLIERRVSFSVLPVHDNTDIDRDEEDRRRYVL